MSMYFKYIGDCLNEKAHLSKHLDELVLNVILLSNFRQQRLAAFTDVIICFVEVAGVPWIFNIS